MEGKAPRPKLIDKRELPEGEIVGLMDTRAELSGGGLIGHEVWGTWKVRPPHWRWHLGLARIIMPVKGPKGNLRGYVLRVLPRDHRQPKALTYQQSTEPWAHWAMLDDTPSATVVLPPVVIVEDIPSAERLKSVGAYGVALMGTHMTDAVESEILEWTGGSRVVVALDRDAVRKGIEIRDKLRMRKAAPVVVGLLEKDVKDMTEEELDLWVKSVC